MVSMVKDTILCDVSDVTIIMCAKYLANIVQVTTALNTEKEADGGHNNVATSMRHKTRKSGLTNIKLLKVIVKIKNDYIYWLS